MPSVMQRIGTPNARHNIDNAYRAKLENVDPELSKYNEIIRIRSVEEIYQEILVKKQCVSLKTLAVRGKDLITEVGMKPGKELGEVLKELLELVIEEPSLNEKETLLAKAAKMIGKVQ